MVERDKDSLKKSLAKSLLHTQSLTEELQTVQAQNRQLVQKVASLEEELEQVSGWGLGGHGVWLIYSISGLEPIICQGLQKSDGADY